MQIVIWLPAGTTVCSLPSSPCVDTFSIVIEPSLGHRTMGTRFAAALGTSGAGPSVTDDLRVTCPTFRPFDSGNSHSFHRAGESGNCR